MFKAGEYTKKFIRQRDGSEVPDKQVQPHGVELTVDKVFKCQHYTVLGDDEYAKAPRREAHLVESGMYKDKSEGSNHSRKAVEKANEQDEVLDGFIEFDNPHYTLIEGPHVVLYNEKIEVPDGHVGFVWPRSRVIRSGNFLSSAVWDSGYEGRGEGGLHINCMTFLEKGMRLGQFVLARANVMHEYDGSHQQENIDK